MELIKEKYKQTEVGLIPSDWEVKKLGDALKVIGGGAFKSNDASQAGVKWLKISNVGINQAVWDDESYLPSTLIKDNENFLLKEGDYVIALTRPILDRKLKIAKLNENDVPALLNQRVGKIEVESQTEIDFAYFLFQKFETINGLLQSMAGTDPPNLSNKGIYGIDCAFPPTLTEQTAIATALSDADALISSLEKLIAKKSNIKQGAMQRLLEPKDGWEVKKLGDIAFVNMGQSPLSEYYNSEGIGLPLVQGNADVEDRKTIIRFYTSMITKKGKVGDIIMSVRAPVGEIAKATFDCCLGRGVCSISFDNEYLYHYLIYFEKSWAKLSTGSTFDSVNSKQVKELEILIPKSKDEQTRIATILSDMDAEINALETKLEKYKKVKLGMMQNLLTGKIRLV